MIRNQKRNSEIISIISKNPGIKFREIMRETGMSNGVLSYYIGKIEKSGTVQVQRSPRQTRFYPIHFSSQESKIIKTLRRQTPRDIMLAIILDENLEFSNIVEKVKKSPSTVSLYLSQLVKDDIVQINFHDRKKKYFIKDKIIIDKLIEEYHPGLLDKPTSGFEDTINAL